MGRSLGAVGWASGARTSNGADRPLTHQAIEPNGPFMFRPALASVALGLLLGVGACSKPTTDFHSVKLGMTAGDVRERTDLPKAGTWKATQAEEMLLDYSPPSGDVPKVRFEFHSGMLVAIRATVASDDPAATALPREVTPGAVIAREKSGSHFTTITWLSRDCPTHKDEAERLVKGVP